MLDMWFPSCLDIEPDKTDEEKWLFFNIVADLQ